MSESFKIIYGPGRFPIQQKRSDGTFGCRGCGGDIPKGRQTWCSKLCCRTYHPAFVISEVIKRDKEICALCQIDIAERKREWLKQKPDYMKVGWKGREAWRRDKPKVNYDHIIPFSEGGMTVLENMRTLCEPCHKKRTKRWYGDRAKSRRPQLEFCGV